MLNFYSLYLCLPHCLSLSYSLSLSLSVCLSVCLSVSLSLSLSLSLSVTLYISYLFLVPAHRLSFPYCIFPHLIFIALRFLKRFFSKGTHLIWRLAWSALFSISLLELLQLNLLYIHGGTDCWVPLGIQYLRFVFVSTCGSPRVERLRLMAESDEKEYRIRFWMSPHTTNHNSRFSCVAVREFSCVPFLF